MAYDPLEVPPGPRKRVTVDGHAFTGGTHDDLFFAAVQTTRMPMIVTDPRRPDNPIVFVNQAFLNMTGYRSEELVGRNCRFLQGPETDRSVVDQVRRAIAEGREIAVEILNYRKDGSSFWNALFISPVLDHDGRLTYFFGSQLDVSRRRDAEDALRQAQKMEALGQLTGGIAHDFNNLLQVIKGYVSVAQISLDQDAKAAADRLRLAVRSIGNAADKAATLTQQLLAFARKQRLDGRVVNLSTLVQELGAMAERTLGEQISLKLQLQPDLPNCRVDPTQTEVALLNVLINARDAMPDGGTVTISTANVDIDEDASAQYWGLAPGRYVTVAVTDTGQGIAPEILHRVMEPFFTTKQEGDGTGLGLSMVYGFAKQSGGIAKIYSEVGIGTTVRLYFPATEADAKPLVAQARAAHDRAGSERILVVDDKPEVAELAGLMLATVGYAVDVCGSAREALARFEEHGPYDLLLTDLIMPGGMNGVMLARELRRRHDGVKVLLTTGYAAASAERTDVGGSEFDILFKPYGQAELARKVRQVLDGPTGVA